MGQMVFSISRERPSVFHSSADVKLSRCQCGTIVRVLSNIWSNDATVKGGLSVIDVRHGCHLTLGGIFAEITSELKGQKSHLMVTTPYATYFY